MAPHSGTGSSPIAQYRIWIKKKSVSIPFLEGASKTVSIVTILFWSAAIFIFSLRTLCVLCDDQFYIK
jgi:hypothetical protein